MQGSREFYLDRKKDAILPVLITQLKNFKLYRADCLAYVLEYLHLLPVELARCAPPAPPLPAFPPG